MRTIQVITAITTITTIAAAANTPGEGTSSSVPATNPARKINRPTAARPAIETSDLRSWRGSSGVWVPSDAGAESTPGSGRGCDPGGQMT